MTKSTAQLYANALETADVSEFDELTAAALTAIREALECVGAFHSASVEPRNPAWGSPGEVTLNNLQVTINDVSNGELIDVTCSAHFHRVASAIPGAHTVAGQVALVINGTTLTFLANKTANGLEVSFVPATPVVAAA